MGDDKDSSTSPAAASGSPPAKKPRSAKQLANDARMKEYAKLIKESRDKDKAAKAASAATASGSPAAPSVPPKESPKESAPKEPAKESSGDKPKPRERNFFEWMSGKKVE